MGVVGGGGASDLQQLPKGNQYLREPPSSSLHAFGAINNSSPTQNRMQHPQRDREYSPSFVYYDTPNNYVDSRNYTDSQLGVVGGGTRGQDLGNEVPISSPPPPPPGYIPTSQALQQQQYSTPRLPRHATVLKDRGSAENSVGSSDPSAGVENVESNYGSRGPTAGSNHSMISPSSMSKGSRGASQSSNKHSTAPAAKSQPKDLRSHTPVRDHMEGQVLFATPNHRRDARDAIPSTTPTNKTSWNRPTSNTSINFNRLHSGSGYSKCGVNYNKGQVNKQHQSKLPHGLTVQELKEMTRARLAAEAETSGPDASMDQSVHSSGSSEQFSSGRAFFAQPNDAMVRRHLQPNEPIRIDYNQGVGPWIPQGQQQQQQQMQQQPQLQMQNISHYQYPRQPSPGFVAGPYHFNGNVPPPAPSSAIGLSTGQSRGQGETWDTASSASSTLAADYSMNTYTNTTQGNRGRCFSAGATTGIPYSFDKNQAAYYRNGPLMGAVNRQECSSMTPPGMSRLHEDRPLLFSNGEKDKLAIPPLSEPRMRFHSTGGLNVHGTAIPPAPTLDNVGNAFVPINKVNDQSWSQLMHPRNSLGRNGSQDRALLAGSTNSGHGDLPSSMAEAVLESITSVGGQVIGQSNFRADHELSGESMASAVFRMGDNLLPETSGSMPLFSSGESRNIFSPKTLLETHSWGGGSDDGTTHSTLGLTHDFSNLWNTPSDNNGPALRGRAATEPSWFGGNDSLLVSRIDPELNPQNRQGGL
ncbi:hypothetical protein ACHAWU_007921 [Discostella pseudostelligera]|uniref:Uncharacterized protein n=1 Tax=Discostella pseudostelligera TaxID=259834 RepID=A0ABD3M9T7_9STRA